MLELLLTSSAAQGALAVFFVGAVGFFIRRYTWMKHVVAFGIKAYEYAESEGILQKLEAYQKYKPFMEKFIALYREKYKQVPSAKAKGIAVAAMEQEVLKEHSTTVRRLSMR